MSLSVARLAAILLATSLLAACGQSEKFNRAAYDVCLAAAKKPGSDITSAVFASFEQSTFGSSTGDDQFRVSIPYEQGEKKGFYQCIAEKRRDGSFAVVF